MSKIWKNKGASCHRRLQTKICLKQLSHCHMYTQILCLLLFNSIFLSIVLYSKRASGVCPLGRVGSISKLLSLRGWNEVSRRISTIRKKKKKKKTPWGGQKKSIEFVFQSGYIWFHLKISLYCKTLWKKLLSIIHL